MKGATRAKGLGELRTASTHHIASKPPREGTTQLNLFSLSMERNRLEQELAGVERRRKRILDRLAEVQSAMKKLEDAAQRENASQDSSATPGADQQAGGSEPSRGRQWRKMAVEY